MEPLAPNLAASTGTYYVESSVASIPEDDFFLPFFQGFAIPSFEDQGFSTQYPYLDQDTDSLFHKQWLDTSSASQTDASLGQTQEKNSGVSLISGNPLKQLDIDASGPVTKDNLPCHGPTASKPSQIRVTENSNKKPKRGRKPAADFKKKFSAERELHIREKNRKAAGRCRSRKQREEEALDARQKTLEAQNNYLYASYNSLKAEIVHIKRQLLQHTDCDCVMIQQYIDHDVKHCLDSLLSRHSSSPYTSGLVRSAATNQAISPDMNHMDNSTLKSI
ncbi:uncharacterized protein FTOL_13587 [Fusarium torulosum]|uniref:BZIP domain-containing protein n=1 Tax=Fusarium torulosum TaxID=33205 RepID=A0AAE8MMF3_9HYPO|nr:uncharacterized protein FTOL_13587 [Fusarium torulosum]